MRVGGSRVAALVGPKRLTWRLDAHRDSVDITRRREAPRFVHVLLAKVGGAGRYIVAGDMRWGSMHKAREIHPPSLSHSVVARRAQSGTAHSWTWNFHSSNHRAPSLRCMSGLSSHMLHLETKLPPPQPSAEPYLAAHRPSAPPSWDARTAPGIGDSMRCMIVVRRQTLECFQKPFADASWPLRCPNLL